jgi:hypothetical protein
MTAVRQHEQLGGYLNWEYAFAMADDADKTTATRLLESSGYNVVAAAEFVDATHRAFVSFDVAFGRLQFRRAVNDAAKTKATETGVAHADLRLLETCPCAHHQHMPPAILLTADDDAARSLYLFYTTILPMLNLAANGLSVQQTSNALATIVHVHGCCSKADCAMNGNAMMVFVRKVVLMCLNSTEAIYRRVVDEKEEENEEETGKRSKKRERK